MDINAHTYSSLKLVKHYNEYSNTLQAPEKTIFELLKPQLLDMKMIDIGVGGGRTTHFFAPLVKSYIGIDFSKGMIDVCKKKFHTSIPSAHFAVCDVRDLKQFKTNSFDFALFSFNGLDNVDHEERLLVLEEIRRICSPNAYFCFSSHNILSLTDFFKIRFRLHPFKFLFSLFNRKKLIANNKDQIGKILTADYLNIYDDVYDFGLNTYYIRPSYQVDILKKIGFNYITLWDIENGEKITDVNYYDSIKNSWVYYLCQ